ncbi:cell division protein FtsZ [bacterium]|nr:MAG: cell division protein FtsZ [bacterium]
MLIQSSNNNFAKIKVVGVGGGGGNAVNNMVLNYMIEGVEFVSANTDAQALANNNAEVKLQLGPETTRGLGAGGNASVGRKAAEESTSAIQEMVAGADMVFVTAGMGGGTGTGAAPIIAKIAKEAGALTVGVVTKPFEFEGKRRMVNALEGIQEMVGAVDTLIVIPNQRLLDIVDKNVSFFEAMRKVDDVLGQAVKSIASLVVSPGLINVDFADVKTVMTNAGTALMGIGTAQGDDRAIEAAKMAVNSPLLDVTIDGATGVLFNISGGPDDLTMTEIDDAAKLIHQVVDPEANIIFGATIDPNMKGTVSITVIATGFREDVNQYGDYQDRTDLADMSKAHTTSQDFYTPTFSIPSYNINESQKDKADEYNLGDYRENALVDDTIEFDEVDNEEKAEYPNYVNYVKQESIDPQTQKNEPKAGFMRFPFAKKQEDIDPNTNMDDFDTPAIFRS